VMGATGFHYGANRSLSVPHEVNHSLTSAAGIQEAWSPSARATAASIC
jgi:hypothetical protein